MTSVGTPLAPAVIGRLRGAIADTPSKMRSWRIACVIAAVVFGVGAFASVGAQRSALQSVRDNSAQLVLIGTIRTSLVEADAVASNAFLKGGYEANDARNHYDAALRRTSEAITAAASSSRGDATELASVNAAITRYSGIVESARATNRQGLQVGAAYLKQASALVRDTVLKTLTKVSARHEATVNRQYRRYASAVIGLRVSAVVGLGVFGAAMMWLALRTRRWLNPAYVIAATTMACALIAAGWLTYSTHTKINETYRADYADTLSLLQARANAFDAKSAESFTLIQRGSGAPYEVQYQQLMRDAFAQLQNPNTADRGAANIALSLYDKLHTRIRSVDDSGGWELAVRAATAEGKGTSGAEFDVFANSNQRSIDRSSRAVADSLDRSITDVNVAMWAVLIGGLVAALLALMGMSARLREYR